MDKGHILFEHTEHVLHAHCHIRSHKRTDMRAEEKAKVRIIRPNVSDPLHVEETIRVTQWRRVLLEVIRCLHGAVKIHPLFPNAPEFIHAIFPGVAVCWGLIWHENSVLPQFGIRTIRISDTEFIEHAIDPNLEARHAVWNFSLEHSLNSFA